MFKRKITTPNLNKVTPEQFTKLRYFLLQILNHLVSGKCSVADVILKADQGEDYIEITNKNKFSEEEKQNFEKMLSLVKNNMKADSSLAPSDDLTIDISQPLIKLEYKDIKNFLRIIEEYEKKFSHIGKIGKNNPAAYQTMLQTIISQTITAIVEDFTTKRDVLEKTKNFVRVWRESGLESTYNLFQIEIEFHEGNFIIFFNEKIEAKDKAREVEKQTSGLYKGLSQINPDGVSLSFDERQTVKIIIPEDAMLAAQKMIVEELAQETKTQEDFYAPAPLHGAKSVGFRDELAVTIKVNSEYAPGAMSDWNPFDGFIGSSVAVADEHKSLKDEYKGNPFAPKTCLSSSVSTKQKLGTDRGNP